MTTRLFGKTIANAVMIFIKSKNVPIVSDEAYAVNTLDFKPIMTKVKANNPDYVLLIAVSTTDAILMTRHAKEMGICARFRRLRRRLRRGGLRQAARPAGGERLFVGRLVGQSRTTR